MHVDISKVKQGGKIYTRALIRESYREGGKVKKRTIANISSCSDEEIQAIKLALQHKGNFSDLIIEPEKIRTKLGLSVGAVLVLYNAARKLGIVKALGNTKYAKLCLWMTIARIILPGISRLEAVRLAQQHAAVAILGLKNFNEDTLYEALDWIASKQNTIEKRLFDNRYSDKKPELFLYDVSSSYLEGIMNELGFFGYNRDKKKGKKIIVFGLLTDEAGWPIAVEVFAGNTQDPATFNNQIEKLAKRFECKRVTMVGDRGMIKSGQIEALSKYNTENSEYNYYYITAITKPQIETLLGQGAIQMELFTEQLVEIEYDNVRYILRRNPVRAAEIKKTRESKINKIEDFLKNRNEYLAEHPRASVDAAVRDTKKLIDKLLISNFLTVNTLGRVLYLECNDEKLSEIAQLDGCYVIKSNVPKEAAEKETIHQRYKDLAYVESTFRDMKTYLLELRPIHVRKESRTRAHVFICMLSEIIVKQLREKWEDMDITIRQAIHELSMICATEVYVGAVKYNQIPEPRDLGLKLIKKLDMILPQAIKCTGIKVDTRKKLKRKKKNR